MRAFFPTAILLGIYTAYVTDGNEAVQTIIVYVVYLLAMLMLGIISHYYPPTPFWPARLGLYLWNVMWGLVLCALVTSILAATTQVSFPKLEMPLLVMLTGMSILGAGDLLYRPQLNTPSHPNRA